MSKTVFGAAPVKSLVFNWAMIFTSIMCCDVMAAPPTLTHLFPAGGQRGAKVTVTCAGKFTWPTKVWAPGIDVVPIAESGKLEISIPSDLLADRVWVRLYNEEGTSTLQPFLVGSLNEVQEVESNDRPTNAQKIADPNVVINGAFKEADVDCFAIELAAGQPLVAALDANTRLGSPMDSIVQVVSQEGVVLDENHDDLNLDPRLSFTAKTAGTYIVRIFAFPSTPNSTIRFNGGVDHIYRLTLTTGPYVTNTLPLTAPLTNPGDVSAAGWNIPAGTKLSVVPFGGSRLVDYQEFEVIDQLRRSPDARIGYAYAPGFPSTSRVRLTPYTVLPMAQELDDKNRITVPMSSTITGCLKSRRQIDEYRVPLMKGEQVLVSVETRGLDLTLDPLLKLVDPNGSAVGEADDTGPSRDAAIAHTAALDGDYVVRVSDRFSRGSDRGWYLLTVRSEQPDFDLLASADSVVVPVDKPGELTVKIQRHGTPAGAIGPITIQAIGLPEGTTAPPVVSEPTGPTSGEVKLPITSSGTAFSGPIRIVGKASQPKELERFARTPARLGVAFETFWLTVIEKPK